MPALKDSFQNGPTQLSSWCSAHFGHSLLSQQCIVLREIEGACVLRQVRDHEESSRADGQANDTVHDEQPLPSSLAHRPVEASVDGRLQISREHASDGGGGVENARSLAQLARLVPTPDEKVCRRVEDALHETDEKSDRDDVVAGRGGGKAESEDRPDELAAGDPDRGADFGEDELAGQLADDISRGPGNIDHVELIRVHL